MLKFTYLLLDLGAIATAVGIGLWKHQAWLTEWRRAITAVLAVAIPFIAWDISATWRGHWSFNPEYTLGPTLGGLPIEEILFFVAIPLVSIAAWELVPVRAEMHKLFRPILWGVVGASLVLLFTNLTHEYSTLVSIIAAGTAGVWLATLRPIRDWLYFAVIMFGLFLAANTALTMPPVVQYGAAHYSGIRIGSIPLEDFFYNFALVNLTVLAWLLFAPKRKP